MKKVENSRLPNELLEQILLNADILTVLRCQRVSTIELVITTYYVHIENSLVYRSPNFYAL